MLSVFQKVCTITKQYSEEFESRSVLWSIWYIIVFVQNGMLLQQTGSFIYIIMVYWFYYIGYTFTIIFTNYTDFYWCINFTELLLTWIVNGYISINELLYNLFIF